MVYVMSPQPLYIFNYLSDFTNNIMNIRESKEHLNMSNELKES